MRSAAGRASAQSACAYPYQMGYTVTTIAGLRVALWYPTQAMASSYAYNSRFSGLVAKDAAPGCGPVPLVVFSHGLGGCGTQSLFFTEELARHGYFVAAPDHDDAAFCTVDNTRGSFRNMKPQALLGDPAAWTDQTYIDRRDDLEDLIDALLVDPAYASTIDAAGLLAWQHAP
jgi:predicted dienelactone hydrolase